MIALASGARAQGAQPSVSRAAVTQLIIAVQGSFELFP